MDPNKALEAFLAAIEEHDVETAQEALIDLRHWLNRGGFPPTLSPEQIVLLLSHTLSRLIENS